MSTIGGPGGVGGPKGPRGLDGPADVADVGDLDEAHDAGKVAAGHAVRSREVDAIAADIAAGKITPQQAVERMVDQIAGSEHLGAADRAELREMLADLIANDPYLSGLIGRV